LKQTHDTHDGAELKRRSNQIIKNMNLNDTHGGAELKEEVIRSLKI
jgi:hypothetical protein